MATASEQNTNVSTDPDELNELWERAQKGDESTLPALREMLKTPHWIEECGNLAKHAKRHPLAIGQCSFAYRNLVKRDRHPNPMVAYAVSCHHDALADDNLTGI